MTTGAIFDAGAFIALQRRQQRMMLAMKEIRLNKRPIVTSAGVVGQVWRGGPRQAPIAQVLAYAKLRVVDLSYPSCKILGLLLERSQTSDVIDAHVASLALQSDWPVFTSDPQDLHRLDPSIRLRTV